jgi:hypothetical protein
VTRLRRGEELYVRVVASRSVALLRAWSAAAWRSRRKAQLEALRGPFAMRCTLRRAWRALWVQWQRLRGLSALGEVCAARARSSAVHRALCSWGSAAEQKRLSRGFIATCSSALLHARALRALRHWHALGTLRASNKRRMRAAIVHMRLRREYVATSHWSFWARRERAARRAGALVASRAVHAIVRRIMAVWLTTLLRRRLLRTLGERVVMLSATYRTAAAVKLWRSFLRGRKQQRKAERAAVVHLAGASAARALRVWAHRGAVSAAARRFCEQAFARVMGLRAILALRQWRLRTGVGRDNRAAQVRCICCC